MDWTYNTIWTDELLPTELRIADLSQNPSLEDPLVGGSYLFVRGFKSAHNNLEDFPVKESVKYLQLTMANITSFKGLSALGKVKRLELEYCLKLQGDGGLSEAADSLEWLHITQAKKFTLGQELRGLSQLKVLSLNSCAPLQDLEFLDDFPNLLDFRFVETNVLSGDLSPLLRHPTLCYVGFLDKRHYNLRSREVTEKLQERRTASVTIARNGPYETFRYNALIA